MTDFRKAFEGVRYQVVMGNAHLELWMGLSKRLASGPLVANTAPTFFGMTLESHLNSAFLNAARAFDTHQDSLNIRTILKCADTSKGSLPTKAARNITKHVRKSVVKLTKLESSLRAVRTRRDKVLAHLDPDVISKPDEIAKASQITAEDLQKIFVVALEMLNGISVPYWDFSASLKLLDIDDFDHALNLIEREKRREGAEYEAKFGFL